MGVSHGLPLDASVPAISRGLGSAGLLGRFLITVSSRTVGPWPLEADVRAWLRRLETALCLASGLGTTWAHEWPCSRLAASWGEVAAGMAGGLITSGGSAVS